MRSADEHSGTQATSALSAFIKAATRPSRYALLIILVLNVLLLSACLVFITPENMASFLPAYMAGPGTFDEHVTGAALRLSKDDASKTFVITLGASSIREALDARDLEEGLKTTRESALVVSNLATGRQSLYDSIALVDKIPSGAGGVLLLGMGPSRLTRPTSDLLETVRQPRLGFRSDSIEALAEEQGLEVPERTGFYPLDNIRFLAPRLTTLLWRTLLMSPQPKRAHLYVGRAPQKGSGWKRAGKRIARRFESHAQTAHHNLELLERLVTLVRARTKLKLVLIEHPMNPRFVREFVPEGFLARHQQLVRAVASRLRVPYLDLNELARITEQEYYDWCHLSDREAIRRCGQAVVQKILPLMATSGKKERPR